jgi:hypothetical protein
MQQAVFIEPVGELLHFISDWKQLVASVKQDQPYLSHPPHATLLVSAVKDKPLWREALVKALSDRGPLEIRILRPFAFFDDPGTGGGHTLALEVDPTPPLMALQRAVAEATLPFVDRTAIPAPVGFQEKEPCRTSFLKWGYPFIGPHWRPHFSVASLLTPREDPLITRFLAEQTPFAMTVSAISLWDIDKDLHVRLGPVCLKGEQTHDR